MDKYKLLKSIGGVLLVIIMARPNKIFGEEPYEYFKNFCLIGERVPGTTGHLKARDFIIHNLKNPIVDSFLVHDTWFYNIYKRFPGENMRIGIAAHWDSDMGCPGANDGGSGVALLLGLADTLERNQPDIAVDILFFDGEDIGQAELIGSKHFAAKCVDNYSFIVILDMVGDKDLQIFQEGNSVKFFPQLVDSIWQIGGEVVPSVFVPIVKYYITDDHIALIKCGFLAIDIIDFDYPYWHTKDDTIDKCSKKSLDIMFKFLLQLAYPAYIY